MPKGIRPANFKDLTGQTFGRLTVVSLAPSHLSARKKSVRWNCRCACGKVKPILGYSLKKGETKSCGCLRRELAAKREITHGHTVLGKQTRTYQCWCDMRKRCSNPKATGYARYGGRGITVCDRWLESFENFLADMGECPAGFEIDRKDVNGNYEPSNCRWLTKRDQSRNKSTNRTLQIDGETLCLKDWSIRSGIAYETIRDRLRKGWDAKGAIFEPVK